MDIEMVDDKTFDDMKQQVISELEMEREIVLRLRRLNYDLYRKVIAQYDEKIDKAKRGILW